jgi:hypothetical protein
MARAQTDTIVVGLDGTERSRDALALEHVLGEALGARLLMAYVHPHGEVSNLLGHESVVGELVDSIYFEDVPRPDSLFRYVARAILKIEPTRENKAELLTRLRDRGVFLIDLKRDPKNGGSLAEEVPGLVRRVRRLAPAKIIVIKSSVFDLVRETPLDAGLPLVDERVPFPGSGRQRQFESSFARALRRKPRPPAS